MVGTHRSDPNLLRDLGLYVYVHLVEIDTLNFVGDLLKDGGDSSARATPSCPEID
jgi:hypothetical protein